MIIIQRTGKFPNKTSCKP